MQEPSPNRVIRFSYLSFFEKKIDPYYTRSFSLRFEGRYRPVPR